MRTLPTEMDPSRAEKVRVTRDAIIVDLADGRTLSVPLSWYPRLQHGTPRERDNWRLVGAGKGIHWPDLDEDISVDGLLAGLPSGESQSSFDEWRGARQQPQRTKSVQPRARKPRGG